MSEWNVTHENFHTKHSVLTAPEEHMPYIIQLHIMAYGEAAEHLISSYDWYRKKKTEAVNAYLIKNSKGEGGRKKKGRGGGGSEGSRKDWAELYGCIK